MGFVPPVLAAVGSILGASGAAAPIVGGLATAVAGSSIASNIGSLIGGGGSKSPEPAQTKAPTVMPTADGDAVERARKRSIAAQAQRSGRSSTMLTSDSSDTLGG